LMKSRYSAFAAAQSQYIIKTTHPNNSDYSEDIKSWRASIDLFSKDTEFLGLEIVEFQDGIEESFVTFRATFSSGILTEKSRFLKVDGRWLYVDGEFTI